MVFMVKLTRNLKGKIGSDCLSFEKKYLDKEREELLSYLKGNNLTGIELGVATGDFSDRMIKSNRFKHFFGVDMYADHHDTVEYVDALKKIGIFSPYKLLRMKFDEAIDLFEDDCFDFVYIDGYAHNGEDGGRAIYSWLKKVKPNAIIAGHDYHKDWPLVIEAVDNLCKQLKTTLYITQTTTDPGAQDNYPSWMIIKSENFDNSSQLYVPQKLCKKAELADKKYLKINSLKTKVRKSVKNFADKIFGNDT